MDQLANKEQTPFIRPVRYLRNDYTEIAKIIEKHNPVFITNSEFNESYLKYLAKW